MKPHPQNAIAPVAGKGGAADQPLAVAQPETSMLETNAAWPVIGSLPTLLAVSIPLGQVRVRDLLDLQQGRIFRSSWNCAADVPLKTGLLQLAYGEFDVLDGNIAVRITRTA